MIEGDIGPNVRIRSFYQKVDTDKTSSHSRSFGAYAFDFSQINKPCIYNTVFMYVFVLPSFLI